MATASWSLIADDLRRTTGRELELLAEESGGWIEYWVFLDGEPMGSFGQSFPVKPTLHLAEVADLLRERVLDEEIWGGWPICPVHRTHPLDPVGDVESGISEWWCPKGEYSAPIGSLSSSA